MNSQTQRDPCQTARASGIHAILLPAGTKSQMWSPPQLCRCHPDRRARLQRVSLVARLAAMGAMVWVLMQCWQAARPLLQQQQPPRLGALRSLLLAVAQAVAEAVAQVAGQVSAGGLGLHCR